MSSLKWADVAHYYLKSGIDRQYSTEKETMGVEIPILRALEDMTDQEILDILGLRVISEGALFAFRQKREWSSAIIAKLIEMGFDVFGLIESGRAIRKGVENG